MNVRETLRKAHPPWLQHTVLVVVVLLCLFGCDIHVDNDYLDGKPIPRQDPVSTEQSDADLGNAVAAPVDTPDPVERTGLFRWQK